MQCCVLLGTQMVSEQRQTEVVAKSFRFLVVTQLGQASLDPESTIRPERHSLLVERCVLYRLTVPTVQADEL